MRLGIFGGSFDPVHYGHLILAEQCLEQARLDRILFMPAAVSPLKSDGPIANDKQRAEMLSLALAGHPHFEITTIELERGGTSYTVNSLNELNSKCADDELFLLMGEDSLDSFGQWKEPNEICSLATPLVVRRPGAKNVNDSPAVDLTPLKAYMDDNQWEAVQQLSIQSRWIDISGTEIRHRVGEEKSIRFLLPRAVEKFIETGKIYQSSK